MAELVRPDEPLATKSALAFELESSSGMPGGCALTCGKLRDLDIAFPAGRAETGLTAELLSGRGSEPFESRVSEIWSRKADAFRPSTPGVKRLDKNEDTESLTLQTTLSFGREMPRERRLVDRVEYGTGDDKAGPSPVTAFRTFLS